jgi:hypothetical protein
MKRIGSIEIQAAQDPRRIWRGVSNRWSFENGGAPHHTYEERTDDEKRKGSDSNHERQPQFTGVLGKHGNNPVHASKMANKYAHAS